MASTPPGNPSPALPPPPLFKTTDLLKSGQNACSPVMPCMRAATAENKNNRPEHQKEIECDLKQVVLEVTPEGHGNVSVTGTRRSALTATEKRADLSEEVNELLRNHAAVIVWTAPAVNAGAGAGGPTRTNQISGFNAGSVNATANAYYTMAARCGTHPYRTRVPEPAGGNDTVTARNVSADTVDWTLENFFRALFGEGKFRDFRWPQCIETTFSADSCGWLNKGDPIGSLSAFARVAVADEWKFEFRFTQGIAINFSETATKTRNLGDNSTTDTYSREYRENGEEKTESRKVVSRDGEAMYSSQKGYEDKSATLQLGPSKGGSSARDIEAMSDVTAQLDKEEQERKKPAGKKVAQSLAAKIAGQCIGMVESGAHHQFGVVLTRNGTSLVDSAKIGETIASITEPINDALDVLTKLCQLLEYGASAGFPVSITVGFTLQLELLRAAFYFRSWHEQMPPVRGPGYFVADCRHHWQVGIEGTIFNLALAPKVEVSAKLLHKWVASGTVTIEGKLHGSCKAAFSLSWVDGDLPYGDIRFDGPVAVSIKGTGEITALASYWKLEGEVASGITYQWVSGFDDDAMRRISQRVRNGRVSFQATYRKGNKIRDWFGIGDSKPVRQWPEHGPFIWVEEGALDRKW